jgi:uncharacterized membrane protein YeaQ/YmgE (transglycosylase-associated protein family)
MGLVPRLVATRTGGPGLQPWLAPQGEVLALLVEGVNPFGIAASARAKPAMAMSGWSGLDGAGLGTQLRSIPSEGDSVLGLIISAIVVGLIIGALGRLVVPGRQDMSIWLTIAIGIVAALVGSLIASALGVGATRGIDWIKLIIQVALAAAGVALVAGRYAPGRRRI